MTSSVVCMKVKFVIRIDLFTFSYFRLLYPHFVR